MLPGSRYRIWTKIDPRNSYWRPLADAAAGRPPCCIEFCCRARGTLPDEKIRRPAARIRKPLVELVRSDPLDEPGDFAVPRGFEIGDVFVPGFFEEGVQCRS